MSISIIQVVIIIFALFAWTRAMLRFKDNHVNAKELVFWSIIWIGVIVVSFIPSIISTVASWVGIASGTNMLEYVSIVILFYLIFRVYVKSEDLDQRMTILIRELSISNKQKKKK